LPISATDLLSRVPARYPTPKCGAHALLTTATDFEFQPKLLPRPFLEAVGGDADWPLPAFSALGGDTIGVVSTSCDRRHLPRREDQLLGPCPCRHCQPPRTRWIDHVHSLSYLTIRSKPSFNVRTRIFSANISPKMVVSNIRSAFHR